ncbi:MAG: hypothetical protein ACTSRA_11580, partial [Promethearchaeota archaeon]
MITNDNTEKSSIDTYRRVIKPTITEVLKRKIENLVGSKLGKNLQETLSAKLENNMKEGMQAEHGVLLLEDDFLLGLQLSFWDPRIGPNSIAVVGGKDFIKKIKKDRIDRIPAWMDNITNGDLLELSKDGLNAILYKFHVKYPSIRGGEGIFMLAILHPPSISIPKKEIAILIKQLSEDWEQDQRLVSEVFEDDFQDNLHEKTWGKYLVELRATICLLTEKFMKLTGTRDMQDNHLDDELYDDDLFYHLDTNHQQTSVNNDRCTFPSGSAMPSSFFDASPNRGSGSRSMVAGTFQDDRSSTVNHPKKDEKPACSRRFNIKIPPINSNLLSLIKNELKNKDHGLENNASDGEIDRIDQHVSELRSKMKETNNKNVKKPSKCKYRIPIINKITSKEKNTSESKNLHDFTENDFIEILPRKTFEDTRTPDWQSHIAPKKTTSLDKTTVKVISSLKSRGFSIFEHATQGVITGLKLFNVTHETEDKIALVLSFPPVVMKRGDVEITKNGIYINNTRFKFKPAIANRLSAINSHLHGTSHLKVKGHHVVDYYKGVPLRTIIIPVIFIDANIIKEGCPVPFAWVSCQPPPDANNAWIQRGYYICSLNRFTELDSLLTDVLSIIGPRIAENEKRFDFEIERLVKTGHVLQKFIGSILISCGILFLFAMNNWLPDNWLLNIYSNYVVFTVIGSAITTTSYLAIFYISKLVKNRVQDKVRDVTLASPIHTVPTQDEILDVSRRLGSRFKLFVDAFCHNVDPALVEEAMISATEVEREDLLKRNAIINMLSGKSNDRGLDYSRLRAGNDNEIEAVDDDIPVPLVKHQALNQANPVDDDYLIYLKDQANDHESNMDTEGSLDLVGNKEDDTFEVDIHE